LVEWPQKTDSVASDVTYRERLEGKIGLTWEEKYLLQLGVLISLDRWEDATELVERGSAAGRLEYPALRRILAELTRGLGVSGMTSFRGFLVRALGDQPEWDPNQDDLLQESQLPGCTDEEKSTGNKALGNNSVQLFRCGLLLGLRFGEQAAEQLLDAKLEAQQIRQVVASLCYQHGFPIGMELARQLERQAR
jgi:hypothetical protein